MSKKSLKSEFEELIRKGAFTQGVLVQDLNIKNEIVIENNEKAIAANVWDGLPEEAKKELLSKGFFRVSDDKITL